MIQSTGKMIVKDLIYKLLILTVKFYNFDMYTLVFLNTEMLLNDFI